MKLAFLDLETTGFEAESDSIIEVALIVVENGQEIDRFESLVAFDGQIPPIVTQITSINDEDLAANGKNWTDIKPKIEKMLEGCVMVGHNIDFDIRFLRANGIMFLAEDRIDTHELARVLMIGEPSYALEVLAQKHDLVHENAHRAMSDVEANLDFWHILLQKIESLPKVVLEKLKPYYQHTNWKPGYFFDCATGLDTPVQDPRPPKTDLPAMTHTFSEFPQLQTGAPTLIPFNENMAQAAYITQMATSASGHSPVAVT